MNGCQLFCMELCVSPMHTPIISGDYSASVECFQQHSPVSLLVNTAACPIKVNYKGTGSYTQMETQIHCLIDKDARAKVQMCLTSLDTYREAATSIISIITDVIKVRTTAQFCWL